MGLSLVCYMLLGLLPAHGRHNHGAAVAEGFQDGHAEGFDPLVDSLPPSQPSLPFIPPSHTGAGNASLMAPGRLEVEDIVARAGDSAPTQEPAVRWVCMYGCVCV